jgi:predicted esterase
MMLRMNVHFVIGSVLYIACSLQPLGCAREVDASDVHPPAKTIRISREAKPPLPKIAVPSANHSQEAVRLRETDVPHIPTDLWVEGFRQASYVGPEKLSPTGAPVVIILHGNYDRPEWECDVWKEVAGFYGWTLCPRGIPTPWADKTEDRWMYQNKVKAAEEIEAALSSLKATYPGRVRDDGMVLVGFSLGAMYAPGIVIASPRKYSWLYLVEGGASQLDNSRIRALKKAGIRGIGMAMSTSNNRTAAGDALKRIKKSGLKQVYVNMAGAGHSYKYDFEFTGRQSLVELLGNENPAPGSEAVVEH